MEAIERDYRTVLLASHAPPCLSLYQPTHRALRWRRKFGQTAKVGSPSWKDELYDWKAEAVLG